MEENKEDIGKMENKKGKENFFIPKLMKEKNIFGKKGK
jgi:hypothetical protein